MASEVIASDEFLQDYDNALSFLYSAATSPKAAVKLIDAVDRARCLLADNPEMCAVSKKAQLMNRGLREYFLGNHVIVYQIDGDIIFLVHLFHQSQDFANLV